MAHLDITTIPGLRRAIKQAHSVHTQVRFGSSERWVKISKATALELIEGLSDHCSPQDAEMYAGTFGTMHGRTLWMG